MDSSIRKAIDSVIAETEAMSDSELQAEFDAAKDGAVGR